ncbi:S8 family serine peptidase [Trichocoleus sp. FACHB-262]|uniref:S8 family serine peptidase n=1 Tax=Trichocoleus sp. FACHB-262 TaxID=2692869 RepID=UPI0016894FBE|nr:S8 family serine peptidase [Trichocoleus sp. FACHB-262]MBD2121870.1 S8 family serine peptidase [Trichocoleus sp. FACHB-262]
MVDRSKGQELTQTFLLEPILTPSGVVDYAEEHTTVSLLASEHLTDHFTDQAPDPLENTELEQIWQVEHAEPLLDGISEPLADPALPTIDLSSSEQWQELSFIDPLDNASDIPEVDTLNLTSDNTLEEAPSLELSPPNKPTAIDDLSTFEPSPDLISPRYTFESGVFTVGESGQVGVDFLFDGGKYQGELAIFSLDGMDQFEPGSTEFIQEAARRALSSSELGHIIISDRAEGARFSAELGEQNWNSGDYLGVKSFSMHPDDEFAVMLMPNGSVQHLLTNPTAGGSRTPLFSLGTANPEDKFHLGQIVDLTGDGNTFVMEDLRMDQGSDRDYNDLIFQVRGATGKAASIDEYIAPKKDWRTSDMGQALIEYAKPYITPDSPIDLVLLDIEEPVPSSSTADPNRLSIDDSNSESTIDFDFVFPEAQSPEVDAVAPDTSLSSSTNILPMNSAELNIPDAILTPAIATDSWEFPREDQPLIGIIDTGFNANNPDIDYSKILLGRDHVGRDANPLLRTGEGDEHGTHVLGIIAATQDNTFGIDGINDDAPLWVGRAVGSGQWADSLVEFVDAAKESGQPNAVVNLSLDLTQFNPDDSETTRYEFTPAERAAIEYARQHNVLIVAAAGNDGGVMSVLGQASQEFDNIITVGAAERINGEVARSKAFDRAAYSSYGNGLDIMAPGGIVENPELSTTGDGVGAPAGTSVASPKVTGAASQVWAANPGLSYRQVIEILKNTATDLKTPGWDGETGAGLLNIAAAVHLAKATRPEEYDVPAMLIPETWSGEGKVMPWERAVGYNTDKVLSVVPSHLKQYAQQSIPKILAAAETAGVADRGQVAYILATAEHESNLGRWMAEIWGPTLAQKNYDNILGNYLPGDGYRYRGRGYVQITGRSNYQKWSQRLGIDLIGNPDLASNPDIAAKILVQGMRDGAFTGVGLGKYISGNSRDFYNARRIVNGIDRASDIAQIAERYYEVLSQSNGINITPSLLLPSWQMSSSAKGVGQVAVGQNADGRLEAFVIGSDNKVYQAWQTTPNGNWSNWQQLSAGIAKTITVGRNQDGRLEVFAIGTDNKVYQAWQTTPNGNWSNWQLLLESGSVSDLTVSQNQDGRLEVFAMGLSGRLQQAWQSQPNSGWVGWYSRDLLSPTTSSVTIGSYTVSGNFYSVFKNYQGTLGNPVSGATNHSSGVTYQLFQNGSIVSSRHGTFPLYGAIRQTYLKNNGLNGWLGTPTSSEVSQGNGVIKQTFEGGYIIWNGRMAIAYRTGSGTPSQPAPNPQPTNPIPSQLGNGQRIIDAVNRVNPDQWFYRPRDITGDGNNETFCNWFAADVFELLGVRLPINGTQLMTKPHPLYGRQDHSKPISAEGLYSFFNRGGGSYGDRWWGKWQRVSAADATTLANQGKAVVASYIGHIAVVIPGGSATNVRIAQAGARNSRDMSVSEGFGLQTPLYFVYEG